MHLIETSLIKKYENDIGSSIKNVGGEVPYDEHWLPYLDDRIENQLVGDNIVDEKIDQKLDERGLSKQAIDAWNRGLEDIENLGDKLQFIEDKPAMNITQEAIDAWNRGLEESVKYTPQPNTTKEQRRQARLNIGLNDEMLDAQWWYGPDEYGRESEYNK